MRNDSCAPFAVLVSLWLAAGGTAAQVGTDIVRISPAQGADGDNFGASAALNSTTALVGAPLSDEFGNNAGAAYVFDFDPDNGSWEQTAIIASDGIAEFAFFARAVALSGDLLIAGSPESPTFYDLPQLPGANMGAAYLFERAGGAGNGWNQVAKLVASDGAFGDEFGRALSITNSTVAIAAQSHYTGSDRAGAVYLYEFNTELQTWEEIQQLLPPVITDLALFGATLAMQAELLAVGAPGAFFSPDNPGAVHVFEPAPPPFTGWNQSDQLNGSGSLPGDRFGSAVAIEGNLIAASSIEDGGTVYIFEWDSADESWLQVARLQPDIPVPAAGFGQSIAIDGGKLIAGAPFDGQDGSGAAYVFSRGGADGNTWNQIAHITVDGTSGARIGFSLVANQGHLLLGAPLAVEVAGAPGAAFIAVTPMDSDGDGIADAEDNCTLAGNSLLLPDAGGNSQRDTDADGFGNLCDADFDGDCSVDFNDLALMRGAFFSSGDTVEDLNGDSSVNFVDLAIMKAGFFAAPGPSGLTTACD